MPFTRSTSPVSCLHGRRVTGSLACYREKRDWVRCFQQVLRDAGDVAYCKYVGIPACLVGHPDQIVDVLVVDAQSYTKSNMLRMLLGDGWATSEGELWRRQRNLLLPVFSRERPPQYGSIITRHIDRMMSSWQDGSVRDIYRDMMRYCWKRGARALLSATSCCATKL